MEEVKKQGMESLFVPYEIALALKELGFDEPCVAIFNRDNELSLDDGFYKQENYHKDTVLAPIFSQAFRWFREKYDLWSCIQKYPTFENPNRCYYELKGNNINTDKNESPNSYMSGWFDSYEKAETNCLKKLIELCKKN